MLVYIPITNPSIDLYKKYSQSDRPRYEFFKHRNNPDLAVDEPEMSVMPKN